MGGDHQPGEQGRIQAHGTIALVDDLSAQLPDSIGAEQQQERDDGNTVPSGYEERQIR